MKKSQNGKTLLAIEDNDIQNGRISIPDSVNNIGPKVFKGKLQLIEVELHDDLFIGNNSFEGCINLVKVTFGKNTTLSNKAFMDCFKLKFIEFGGYISINNQVFKNCQSIDYLFIYSRW